VAWTDLSWARELALDVREALLPSNQTGAAVFSVDGVYRYVLLRCWDTTIPPAVFCLCNPSTAGSEVTDPTLTRGVGYARAWGCGGVVFVNPAAFCATDPKAMLAHPGDIVGPHNAAALAWAAALTGHVIGAWGSHGEKSRMRDVVRRTVAVLTGAGAQLCALGLTATGSPVHPLMQPKAATRTPYVYGGDLAATRTPQQPLFSDAGSVRGSENAAATTVFQVWDPPAGYLDDIARYSAAVVEAFLAKQVIPAVDRTPYAAVLWERCRVELGDEAEMPETSDDRWTAAFSLWTRTGRVKRIWPEVRKVRQVRRDVIAMADNTLDPLTVAQALGLGDDECPKCRTSGPEMKYYTDRASGRRRWKHHRSCQAFGGAVKMAQLVLGDVEAYRLLADQVGDQTPPPEDWPVDDMSAVPDDAEEAEAKEDDTAAEKKQGAAAWYDAGEMEKLWDRCRKIATLPEFRPGIRVETAGSVLTAPADVRVCAVDCDGVALAYPGLLEAYRAAQLMPGEVFRWVAADGDTLLCVATEDARATPSQLEWIGASVQELRRVVDSIGRVRVAIPPLGCQNGGMAWDTVRQAVLEAFEGCHADVAIYAPGAEARTGIRDDAVTRFLERRSLLPGLDARAADTTVYVRRGLQPLLEQAPAVVTPIRDHSGAVRNLQLRFVAGAHKSKFVNGGNPGATYDGDRLPYAYGRPEQLDGAGTALLCEGWGDYHTARQLMGKTRRVSMLDAHDVAAHSLLLGNPWSHLDTSTAEIRTSAHAAWLERGEGPPHLSRQREDVLAMLPQLRGKRIACVCAPQERCHVDTLVRMADHTVCVLGSLDAGSMPSLAKLVHRCKVPPRRVLVIPHRDAVKRMGNRVQSVGNEAGKALLDELLYGDLPPDGSVVVGTGHRPQKLSGDDIDERLYELAVRLILKIKPTAGVSGMAQGWDKALARAFTAQGVPWTAAVPCDRFEERWPADLQAEYRQLLKRATTVHVVCPGPYRAGVLQARNVWMATCAGGTHTLALWSGAPGGTADYIRDATHPVYNAWKVWDTSYRMWDWASTCERLRVENRDGWDLNDLLVAVGAARLCGELQDR